VETCPSNALPVRIGDKWTAWVVRLLEHGPRRFTELRKGMGRVTPKVLTETLRAMERDGMVTRSEFDEIPPRVEYELTELGHSLRSLLDHTCAWTRENLPLIEAAQKANDGADHARTS
jgi:DNA-binding HxlR family transcriptional regulator